MAKYSHEVIDDLLHHLDALDVLELIDFHPESIQREGDFVRCFCPLCQNLADRYLTINLRTGSFTSAPPDMPSQTGTMIDLFARVRRISLDEAIEILAEEFGVLLLDPEASRDMPGLLNEARSFLDKAQKEPGKREGHLREAEKRYARLIASDAGDLAALRGMMDVRMLEGNPLTIAQTTLNYIEACRKKGDENAIVEAARLVLKSHPEEIPVRRALAESLIRLGQSEDAIREFMSIAEAAEHAGQTDEALAIYHRIQQIGSESIDAHPLIVTLLVGKGRRREAFAEIKNEIERLKSLKKYHEAGIVAQSKLRLDPNDDDTRIQVIELAIMSGLGGHAMDRCLQMVHEMVKAGRDRRAAEALSYLTAERPDDTQILGLLIDTYRRLGEDDLVSELEYRLVDIHLEKGDLPAVNELLKNKIIANPDDTRARKAMALVKARRGDRSGAIEDLHELVDIFLSSLEDDAALEAVQRICQIDPEQWDDREREIEMLFAMSRGPEAEQRLLALIRDLEDRGDHKRLIKLLESHLKLDPDFLPAIKALSNAYDRIGRSDLSGEVRMSSVVRLLEVDNLEKAEVALKEFLEARPDDPELLENLGELYARTGRKAEARQTQLRLAEAHSVAGRKDKQRAVLLELCESWPNDLDILSRAFVACERDGDDKGLLLVGDRQVEALVLASDLKGAVEKAEAIVQRHPRHEKTLRALVTIYGRLGRRRELQKTGKQLAAQYAQQGDLKKQRELLTELLTQDPEDPETIEMMILLVSEQRDRPGLEKLLKKYLAERSGDIDRAIKLLRRVIAGNPEMNEVRLDLIALLRTAGRDEELVTELEAAVEQFEAARDKTRLAELYEQLVRVRPDNLIARARHVELLRSAGRQKDAMREHLQLAEQYRAGRRLSEALAAYERLSEDDPRSEEILRGHASLLKEMGRKDAAARKLRRLASLLAEQGNSQKGIALLRETLADDSEDDTLRMTLVELLRNAQRFEEAAAELCTAADRLFARNEDKAGIASLREAAALLPDAVDIHERLIQRLHASGRHDEAVAEQLNLAETLTRQGQPQKALGIANNVIEGTPQNLAARRLRARIYDSIGDEKSALAEYRDMQQYLDRAPSTAVITPGSGAEDDTGGFFPGLSIMQEFEFDSFVVGSKNNFAYAMAKAVAAQPGTTHNPLFLYSDVGLGKTHLLQAIANELRKKNPNIRILYASTEYFTSALVEAIQNNTISAFRARHRKSDVLLLDDVQFLAGKERSQEEFFHIFNILHQDGRQIVVTSDRPPKDIAHLDMRIRSRFGQGVIVDIQPPDLETRLAILRAESGRRKVDVPADALSVIAERVNTNIRELKGAFNQLITQHQLCNDPLNARTARNIVEKLFAG